MEKKDCHWMSLSKSSAWKNNLVLPFICPLIGSTRLPGSLHYIFNKGERRTTCPSLNSAWTILVPKRSRTVYNLIYSGKLDIRGSRYSAISPSPWVRVCSAHGVWVKGLPQQQGSIYLSPVRATGIYNQVVQVFTAWSDGSLSCKAQYTVGQ